MHDAQGRDEARGPEPPATPIDPSDGFEAAFRASPVALAWARDPRCEVVVRNAAMNRLLPASLDWRAWRLSDGSPPPLFDADGGPLPPDREPLRRAAAGGERTTDLPLELRWPGRDPVFLSVGAEPLLGADGRPRGAVASAVDVSAAHRAERARREASRRDTAERLDSEAASRAKDEFIGLLGHELRNPMNAIATAVEVLNRVDPVAPEALSARGIVARQTRRLAHLLGDMTEVGRAFAGRIELVSQPFDLGALVHRRVDRAAAKAEARGQRFHVDVDEVRIDADAERLAEAFDRLLDETVRGALDGAILAVRLRGNAAAAVLEVREVDDVARLPALDLDLPPPAAPPGERFGGAGLAMPLVRRIVEKHGGRLANRRRDPATGGVVHTVRLPLGGADAPQAPAASDAVASVGVVEDDLDALAGLGALLEMGGHAVTTAQDGPGGVAMLLREAPDVAIVDIGLPGFDGFEVARRSRAGGYRGRLIALSGYGHTNPPSQAPDAAFEVFLVKPVDSERLSRLIATPTGAVPGTDS